MVRRNDARSHSAKTPAHRFFGKSTNSLALCAMLIVCFSATIARATTRSWYASATWNGSTGNWSDYRNWSSYSVPNVHYDVTMYGGTAAIDSHVEIQKLDFSGGTLAVAGSGSLTCSDVMTWTGGTLSGPGWVTAAAGLVIGGSNPKCLSTSLANLGTAIWTGTGSIEIASGCALYNSGLFDIQNDADLFASPTVWANVSNSGTFRKSLGTSTTNIAASFLNWGTVEVQSGTLAFLRDFTQYSGTTSISPGGTLVAGSRFFANKVVNNGQLVAQSTMTIGDRATYDGYSGNGRLDVGNNKVTFLSAGFVPLNGSTTLAAGTIEAANGVALGSGASLVGSGTVNGKISAAFGSTIRATGTLALGDKNSYAGFTSDGELYTGGNNVTINDRNVAVLGSLTQLGDASSLGTLTAGNAHVGDTQPHFLLEQGKNLVGRGYVNGNFKNQGDVVGDGMGVNERIVFNSPWVVSGNGTFTNTLVLGTFSPGDSPAISNGTNQAFAGTVQIELGGTTPGNGNDNHDQINDWGTLSLFDSPTLSLLAWNGFVPQVGDEFTVMTWHSGLEGTFGSFEIDPWFQQHGLSFAMHYNNVAGEGSLSLVATAVPEPAAFVLLAMAAVVLLARKLRRR